MAERILTAEECKIGRIALGWSQDELAQAAAVTPSAVQHIEQAAGDEIAAARIEAALEAAGVTFHTAPDGKAYMRARTLDGIIEAPVMLSPRL